MIKKISIKDQVYEEIRKSILTGKYQSGDELVIAHIAAEMGVSNTPVREALSQLSSENLVEATHNYKYRIISLVTETVQELNQAATSIILCGYNLCLELGITDELKQNLRKVYEAQTKLVGTKDMYKYIFTAMSFDEMFIRTTNNKYLIAALNQFTTMLALSIAAIDDSFREANLREHKVILDAVESDDADKVIALIKQHFDKPAKTTEQ